MTRSKPAPATDGVIGVSAFAPLVSEAASTVDDVLRHVDHIARISGVEHVALGMDVGVRT